jgi:hypothetical protein
MLGEAAAQFESAGRQRVSGGRLASGWDGHEGPRARVAIGPGSFRIRRRNLAQAERTKQRELDRHQAVVDELAAQVLIEGEFRDRPPSRREITHWSRKSRANMVAALCEIDFREMLAGHGPHEVPAMVTLTYPGDWLTVAPRGSVVKEHLEEFRARFERAWLRRLQAIWKLEFQYRGAPHFHLLFVPPHGVAESRSDAVGAGLPFRDWLSVVWADIVNHPDPVEYVNHLKAGTGVDFAEGMRARDPKRTAVYFLKHAATTFGTSKEYQHVVPDQWTGAGDGPGRFWGYWTLKRTVWSVEITNDDAVRLARVVRRWSKAQGVTRQIRAPRTVGGRPVPTTWDVVGLAGAQLLAAAAPTRTRRVRRRVLRLRRGAGWVAVNNGATFASKLAAWLWQVKGQRGPDPADAPT